MNLTCMEFANYIIEDIIKLKIEEVEIEEKHEDWMSITRQSEGEKEGFYLLINFEKNFISIDFAPMRLSFITFEEEIREFLKTKNFIGELLFENTDHKYFYSKHGDFFNKVVAELSEVYSLEPMMEGYEIFRDVILVLYMNFNFENGIITLHSSLDRERKEPLFTIKTLGDVEVLKNYYRKSEQDMEGFYLQIKEEIQKKHLDFIYDSGIGVVFYLHTYFYCNLHRIHPFDNSPYEITYTSFDFEDEERELVIKTKEEVVDYILEKCKKHYYNDRLESTLSNEAYIQAKRFLYILEPSFHSFGFKDSNIIFHENKNEIVSLLKNYLNKIDSIKNERKTPSYDAKKIMNWLKGKGYIQNHSVIFGEDGIIALEYKEILVIHAILDSEKIFIARKKDFKR